MIPYTLVLEPGLKIYKIYNGYWYWGRPSIAELWADLRDITRRARPDWDIGSPEMRAAWDRGERAGFFHTGSRCANCSPRANVLVSVIPVTDLRWPLLYDRGELRGTCRRRIHDLLSQDIRSGDRAPPCELRKARAEPARTD
jgi:hypothetical protein